MELSVFTKIKVALSLSAGILLVGLIAWPMLAPATSFDAVVFYHSDISFAKMFLLCILAVIAGFAGGLLSRPYNREIGVLAAPAGLAVIAVFSGDMTMLLKENATVESMAAVYSSLRFESFGWLVVVFAGIAGAIISNIFRPVNDGEILPERQVLLPVETNDKKTLYLNIAAALIVCVVIADLVIRIFARDVIVSRYSSTVVAAPAGLQVDFAVFAGFLAASFLTKLLFKTSYIWPILAAAIVSFVEMSFAGRSSVLNSLAQHWPIGYYIHGTNAILPVQYISFGALGSVAGYWWAIQYGWWRKYSQ